MNARVSLVIPVYNEVDRMHDCLAAIAAQTVAPFEVIVVDNNSTDGTAAIAASFPFVTVLHERRQGVVYARDRGFNAARGDIIGRIDADTLLDDDWIERLTQLFAGPEIDLVTGSVTVREMAAAKLASAADLFWRRHLYRRLGTEVGLQGANMALRRLVWRQIRHDVCHQKDLHEDFDIGIHARHNGYVAVFDEQLRASVCHRQLQASFGQFWRYAMTSPRTYLNHGLKSGRIMYRVVAFVVLLYPIIVVLARGYDPQLRRFSLRTLLASATPARVSPALFVD